MASRFARVSFIYLAVDSLVWYILRQLFPSSVSVSSKARSPPLRGILVNYFSSFCNYSVTPKKLFYKPVRKTGFSYEMSLSNFHERRNIQMEYFELRSLPTSTGYSFTLSILRNQEIYFTWMECYRDTRGESDDSIQATVLCRESKLT